MFYNSGEVRSDQFNYLILIQNLEKSEKNRRKQEVLGIFFFERGGHLFLKVNVRKPKRSKFGKPRLGESTLT